MPQEKIIISVFSRFIHSFFSFKHGQQLKEVRYVSLVRFKTVPWFAIKTGSSLSLSLKDSFRYESARALLNRGLTEKSFSFSVLKNDEQAFFEKKNEEGEA